MQTLSLSKVIRHDVKLPRARMTRIESREFTRGLIIDAAARVFLKRGYDAASIEEITESAGYTRGAFYSNFATKEDLLLALLERSQEQDRLQLAAIFRPGQSIKQKLNLIRTFIVSQVDQREIYVLFLQFKLVALRNPVLGSKLLKIQRKHRSELQTLLDTLFAELGTAPRMPTQDLVTSILSQLEGLNTQCVLDPVRLPPSKAREHIGHFWDRMIADSR